MSQVRIRTNKNTVLDRIAGNLNIDTLRQGTYLNTVVDGFYELNKDTVNEINKTLKNLDVDTADEDVVEDYGASKGLPRIKTREVTATKADQSLSIVVDMYRDTPNTKIIIYSRGDVITSDQYIIKILEDVEYNSNLGYTYISANISINEYNASIGNTILEPGSEIILPVQVQNKSLIEKIKLRVENNIVFSPMEESLDSYRNRLKTLMMTDNISSESSLKSALASTPYVDDYHIDMESFPHKIYLFSNLMYHNPDLSKFVLYYSSGILDSLIRTTLSYTSNFEIFPAERCSFIINVKTSSDMTKQFFNEFGLHLYNSHILGRYLTISKSLVENYVGKINESLLGFEVEIFYYFNGIKVRVPEDTIILKPHQYPYLVDLTVNEDHDV